MHKRLNDFLETNDVLHNLQFGFRQKHSTSHALISLTEKIKQTIDKGNLACGVFIDLKKAFDTVNHTILLQKLEHYGIRGIPLQWFKSYLTGRKQYVSVCGNTSETLEIKCGVPQGSVLGPLLFLLYINDLAKVSKKLTFFLFADDTNIHYESSNILDIQKLSIRNSVRFVSGLRQIDWSSISIKQILLFFTLHKTYLMTGLSLNLAEKRSTRKLV